MRRLTTIFASILMAMPGLALAASPSHLFNQVRVSVGFSHVHANPAGMGSAHGWQPAFGLTASMLRPVDGVSGIYAAMHFRHSSGTVQQTMPGYTTDTSNGSGDTVSLRLGKSVAVNQTASVIPYVTAGYQTESWSGGTFGPVTKTVASRYAGAGAIVAYDLAPRVTVDADLGLSEDFHPMQSLSLNGGAPYSRTFEATGPRWRFGGGAQYDLTHSTSLTGNVELTRYGVGAQRVDRVVMLAGLGYHF